MQIHDAGLFTPTEAAVLSGLSLKAVNNAIDKKTVATSTGERAGQASRLLDLRAVMSLALERRLADRFAPELRREVFAALEASMRTVVSLDGGFLTIDLRESRRELARALRALRRAQRLVVSDPDTMGGEPVFRDTRVPVSLIAKLVSEGSGVADLLEAYPRLTAEMIRLAPVYAAAYPQRGRPRRQPWHDRPPVATGRRKPATIEVG